MSEEIKKIPIKEFREIGFLQEVNRQFLHPHGLALQVTIDDDGNESLDGIWDYREDPVGIIYDLKNSDNERIQNFVSKRDNVLEEYIKHRNTRIEKLGNVVEFIPEK